MLITRSQGTFVKTQEGERGERTRDEWGNKGPV
jgi:hypothetical protein